MVLNEFYINGTLIQNLIMSFEVYNYEIQDMEITRHISLLFKKLDHATPFFYFFLSVPSVLPFIRYKFTRRQRKNLFSYIPRRL